MRLPMNVEIEVKFCQVDIDDIRARLRNADAHLEQPMRLMRRQVFYTADKNPDAYLRVRAEGDKTTMTYKRFDEIGLHGAKEIETTVGDYQSTIDTLRETGLIPKSAQETRRETWSLGEVEIVIDEWPWLEPFVEIEGPSEELVRTVAAALKFDWDDAVFGGATQAYRVSYPALPKEVIMDDVAEIRFDLDPPERLRGKA